MMTFDLERIELVDEDTHFEADPLGVDIVPSRGDIRKTQAGDIAYRSMCEIASKSGLSIEDLVSMVSARDQADRKRRARRESIRRREERRFA